MADDNPTPTTESQPEAATERPLSLLASEEFGTNYFGEVKQPEKSDDEPKPDDPPPPETDDDPDKVADPEKQTTDEEQPISTVSELVEHLEADPEWFDTLKVPVKVDGQASEAALKDVVNSYQIQQAAEHRLEEAKTKAKAILQEASEKSESLQSQFSVVAKLIENAESFVDQETKNIDWAKLREDDPAEYSARKADVAERRERLEEMKRNAQQEYQKTVQQNHQEMQERMQQHLQKEHAALLDSIPEWSDADKAKAGKAKLAEYLMNQGFSQQDVQAASDHRLILMARKAQLYDELQANTDAAKKKVVTVPKVLKPGAPRSKEQTSREESQKLRAKLKSSGSVDDAFAVLKSRRKS